MNDWNPSPKVDDPIVFADDSFDGNEPIEIEEETVDELEIEPEETHDENFINDKRKPAAYINKVSFIEKLISFSHSSENNMQFKPQYYSWL